mmetsp:Transcript_13275/g.30208  ORF Transcript_13275/g.30208 Transcript_13275/m.30208 type:complete len:85 (+) Transcript_13275:2491-2745(+)
MITFTATAINTVSIFEGLSILSILRKTWVRLSVRIGAIDITGHSLILLMPLQDVREGTHLRGCCVSPPFRLMNKASQLASNSPE